MKEEKITKNKAGIPVKKEDSKQFRAEQRRWKKDDVDHKTKNFEGMSYWQKQSNCTSL